MTSVSTGGQLAGRARGGPQLTATLHAPGRTFGQMRVLSVAGKRRQPTIKTLERRGTASRRGMLARKFARGAQLGCPRCQACRRQLLRKLDVSITKTSRPTLSTC